MAPFSSPKSTKIRQKIDSKMHQILDRFFDRFFIDVGSILEADLEPCWPPFPPKSRAKRASTPAQSDQDRQDPQKPEIRPPIPYGVPLPTSFLEPTWVHLGPFWRGFWNIFGPRFGTYFVHFLYDFRDSFGLIRASAVAGSPLCGALDPPRQALCLRMAYRVPYPNGVLDAMHSQTSSLTPSCHPSSYMNLPIFKALGHLTAYIPPPESSPWTFALVPPRHLGPSLAPLGRVLGDKMAFPKKIDFHVFFHYFGAPGAPNIRQNGFKKSWDSSQDGVRNNFIIVNIVL